MVPKALVFDIEELQLRDDVVDIINADLKLLIVLIKDINHFVEWLALDAERPLDLLAIAFFEGFNKAAELGVVPAISGFDQNGPLLIVSIVIDDPCKNSNDLRPRAIRLESHADIVAKGEDWQSRP